MPPAAIAGSEPLRQPAILETPPYMRRSHAPLDMDARDPLDLQEPNLTPGTDFSRTPDLRLLDRVTNPVVELPPGRVAQKARHLAQGDLRGRELGTRANHDRLPPSATGTN